MGGNSRPQEGTLTEFQADRLSQDKNSIEKLKIFVVPKFKALMKFGVLKQTNASAI